MRTPACTDPADPGLFGPDSVTWRIHAEPILWVGGLRALFLQALHPLAMRGVEEHSSFDRAFWTRLIRTGEYVGTTTFGTTTQAQRAGARVRGMHRRVTGVEPSTGTPYRAYDHDLLLWVHVCEVDSFLDAARRSGVGISDADADRYLAEQVRAAELVGLPAGIVPSSRAQVAEYYRQVRPQLRVTPAAREGVRRLLVPPLPPLLAWGTPARPAWLWLATLSAATMPRWARRMYGLPGLPTTDLGAALVLHGLHAALQVVPAALREGPAVRAARARVAA